MEQVVGKALGSKDMGRGCWGEVWGTVNRGSTQAHRAPGKVKCKLMSQVRGFPSGV